MPALDASFLAYAAPDPADTATRLSRCERRWEVQSSGPLSGGFRAQVFECVGTDGAEAVVKLVVHPVEAAIEAAALAAWAGTGAAVRLLDFAPEDCALLLERVRPATVVPPGSGAEVIEIAGGLLGRLHVPPPDAATFPSFADVYDAWERRSTADNVFERQSRSEPGRGQEGVSRLPAARRTALALSATVARAVLLHGDFTDKNLLLDGTRYVTIDPIPRLGDPCSDVGFFAAGRPPVCDVLDLAAAIAARLGLDPARAQRWAAVWAVHQAVQAWRPDQEDLDGFVARVDAARLLDGS